MQCILVVSQPWFNLKDDEYVREITYQAGAGLVPFCGIVLNIYICKMNAAKMPRSIATMTELAIRVVAGQLHRLLYLEEPSLSPTRTKVFCRR